VIKRTLVIENPSQLSLRQEQMLVRRIHEGESSERTVPIEDIGVLMLESEHCTITTALLTRLMERNVAVIGCDGKHMPVGLWLPLEGNTLQSARFQMQIATSLPLKKNVWAQLIKCKLENQGEVLLRQQLEHAPLIRWASEVRSGDMDNFEARGAAYYWNLLFEGQDFRRERFGPPPNHLFNYGYAILRAIIARALVGSGLFPTFGVHHKNQYNAYCLADDVMEPYRPIVDAYILDHLHEMEVGEELTREWKLHLLKIPTLDVMLEKERRPLLIAASMTTSSLVKVLEGKEKKVLLPQFPKHEFRTNQRL
jgi:CRISPR-associated protein Cas1